MRERGPWGRGGGGGVELFDSGLISPSFLSLQFSLKLVLPSASGEDLDMDV